MKVILQIDFITRHVTSTERPIRDRTFLLSVPRTKRRDFLFTFLFMGPLKYI